MSGPYFIYHFHRNVNLHENPQSGNDFAALTRSRLYVYVFSVDVSLQIPQDTLMYFQYQHAIISLKTSLMTEKTFSLLFSLKTFLTIVSIQRECVTLPVKL